ncbi:MAG: hypothetical protein ABIL09_06225 [Gemmatimonadota bacterium]
MAAEYTCFHIPGFAAWALSRRLRADRLALREIAVVWAGQVFSCTPGLDRSGVAVGDPVDRARSLAPHAEFHRRDLAIEKAVWDSVLGRLYEHTPQVEPLPDPGRSTRGPAAVDGGPATADGLWDNGAWCLLDRPSPLDDLVRATGACLGVAPGRAWSLLAAVHSGAGRCTRVPEGMVVPFLRQAPVNLLTRLSFSPELVQRLELFGLRAVGHLLGLKRRHLEAQFGPEGRRLHAFLNPARPELPVRHGVPRVLSAAHDFEWPVFEPGQLLPVLHHLLQDLHRRLEGRTSLHLEVRLKGRGRASWRECGRLLKDATSQLTTLSSVGATLLLQALQQPSSRPGQVPCGRGVERLLVTLSGLADPRPEQASLFRQNPGLPSLVRRMEVRFPGKLLRPVQAHTDPFFPEEEYRFEPVST